MSGDEWIIYGTLMAYAAVAAVALGWQLGKWRR